MCEDHTFTPFLNSLMRNFFQALLLALTSSAAASQSLTYKHILDKPELATTRPDHKIAYGPGAQQYGELWLPPANVKGPLPVVVLIHGGCWLAALPGPELVAFLSDDLRKHGVAVWSLTYRRVGHDGGGYPGTFDDVANGVAHLRAMAEKYNLDLNRVVGAGHSAGGHLALWAASQNRIPAGSAIKREQAVKFRAVVGIAAINDLAYYSRPGAFGCGESIPQLVDMAARTPTGGPANAAFRDTSPWEMLPLGVKQILIHGVYDGIVPPVIGWRYHARAKESGDNVELLSLENSGHYELIAPWTPAGKVVVGKILEALK